MPAPRDCTLCPALVKCRTQVVNSSGPSDARIAFVGEGPGRDEDQQGRPFIGKAGKVLRILEWAVGINQHQAYYANATRCYGQRTPKPAEIDACHNYLIEDLIRLMWPSGFPDDRSYTVSLGCPQHGGAARALPEVLGDEQLARSRSRILGTDDRPGLIYTDVSLSKSARDSSSSVREQTGDNMLANKMASPELGSTAPAYQNPYALLRTPDTGDGRTLSHTERMSNPAPGELSGSTPANNTSSPASGDEGHLETPSDTSYTETSSQCPCIIPPSLKVIVALGGPALQTLYKRGVGVREVMGFTLYNQETGLPVIGTYHPSYISRGHWNEVALVLKHFRKAKRIADAGGIEEKYGSYTGITTLDQLRALRDYLLGPEVDLIAIDTETCGLSWMDDELLCVQFSPEPSIGYSVPIMHRGEREIETVSAKGKVTKKLEYYPAPFWDMDAEMPEVISILDEILRSSKPKAGQNIGFDIRMLERSTDEQVVKAMTAFGFHVNNVTEDTRLRASLVSEATPANLTLLTALYTDIPYYEAKVSKMKAKMWEVPDDDTWEYGAADVDVVHTLLPVLTPIMEAEQTSWVYENISIPLIRCATKLEERGVYIDQEHLAKLCSYYNDRLIEEKEKLTQIVGKEVATPSYYATVQDIVFKQFDLPLTAVPTKGARKECPKCRKNQAPCSRGHSSTAAADLKELNERSPHPVLSTLIDIRHLEKFKGTYMDGADGEGGFLFHIREDGRIHARWNSARASTGRFSCEYPNLMNPPKDVKIHDPKYGLDSDDAVRDMFAAPLGYAILNADWSQAELWVMAYETQDETMMGLLESGTDIHAYVGRELCKLGVSSKFPANIVEEDISLIEWSAAHKSVRDAGKVFVFGINYGLTESGAGQRLGCTKEEAAPLLAHYVQAIFPGLGAYFSRIRSELYKYGSVSNKFGRRGHFPEIAILSALRYRGDLEGTVRVGFNMPIQSGAHDLHSLAHIATEAELSSWIEPVVEMHDSLMMYTPIDRLEEAAGAVRSLWEGIAHNTVLSSGERLNWNIPVDVQGGQAFGSLVKI